MKETESPEPTPEQLLQMLEAQMASQRSQRTQSNRNRAMILVGGVVFIVIAATGALLVAEQMLMDMRMNDRQVTPAATPSSGKF